MKNKCENENEEDKADYEDYIYAMILKIPTACKDI
jgi:hypothetical protein